MILYFSGTGNSEYAAKRLGQKLQEDVFNLFEKIRDHDVSELHSDRPWVILAPTYAWRLPRVLQEWLKHTPLSGSRNIYFVLTCGGSIGNAGAYLKKLSISKGLCYMGCAQIIMPENYIAMFSTPSEEDARKTIRQAERIIDSLVPPIRSALTLPSPSITLKDRLNSGIVNDLFYPLFVHAKKFYATDACVSCGHCAAVCPLKNIRFTEGKPAWGNHCTHCMACICRCPKEAIEYGAHSKGLNRYTFPSEMDSEG